MDEASGGSSSGETIATIWDSRADLAAGPCASIGEASVEYGGVSIIGTETPASLASCPAGSTATGCGGWAASDEGSGEEVSGDMVVSTICESSAGWAAAP